MNRILNSVLISVVAFFAILAAFALPGLRGADGSTAGHASLAGVAVAWGETRGSDPAGATALDVTLTVQNEGPAATVALIAYEALLDGVPVGSGTAQPQAPLPPGRHTEVPFAATFGPDLARAWWRLQAEADDGTTLLLRGEATVQEGDDVRILPFEWKSAWESGVADLVAPLEDCPRPGHAVCLDDVEYAWSDDGLVVRFTLLDQEGAGLRVRDGTLALDMGKLRLAQAPVLDPDGQEGEAGRATLQATLDARPDALAAWWPAHVAGCERSPAQVRLQLQLEDAYGWDAGTATWETPAVPYMTAIACNGVA